MADTKNKEMIDGQMTGCHSTNQNRAALDLTDEERFSRISKDPYFKKKSEEAAEILSNLKPGQEW